MTENPVFWEDGGSSYSTELQEAFIDRQRKSREQDMETEKLLHDVSIFI